jgi:hypothetical protein
MLQHGVQGCRHPRTVPLTFGDSEQFDGLALMRGWTRIACGRRCQRRLPSGRRAQLLAAPTGRTRGACRPRLGMPSANQASRHTPAQIHADGKDTVVCGSSSSPLRPTRSTPFRVRISIVVISGRTRNLRVQQKIKLPRACTKRHSASMQVRRSDQMVLGAVENLRAREALLRTVDDGILLQKRNDGDI